MEATFGSIIYEYRKIQHKTIREIAEKIGVTPAFLSMLERDKNIGTASEATIEKLAKILKIDRVKLLNSAKKIPTEELQKIQKEAFTFFRKDLKQWEKQFGMTKTK